MRETLAFLEAGIRGEKALAGADGFGVIFAGPPGTAKSLTVGLLAEITKAGLFTLPVITGPIDVMMAFGAARAFVKGKDYKVPAILHFQDVDCMGKRSEGAINVAYRPALAQLLNETDSPGNNRGVFWFLSSNMPEMLDEALNRPPRTLIRVEFTVPNRHGRREILRVLIPQFKADWGELGDGNGLVDRAVNLTPGFTGADLYGFVYNVTIQASLRNSERIIKEDIDRARKIQRASAIMDLPFVEPALRLTDLVGGYIKEQVDMLAMLAERIDNGMQIIIYGPAGCGKTALALGIGGQFGYNVLYFNPADIIDKFLGESGKILARMFNRARALAPCLLIIDQAEGVINPSNPYSKEWLSVLNANTSQPIPGVMLILTTTNPLGWGTDILSRYMKIFVPKPDTGSVTEIIGKALNMPDINEVLDKMVDDMVDPEKGYGRLAGIIKEFTPRQIVNAMKMITDLGRKPTLELLAKIGAKIDVQQEEVSYDTVKAQIGDDVQVFKEIMKE